MPGGPSVAARWPAERPCEERGAFFAMLMLVQRSSSRSPMPRRAWPAATGAMDNGAAALDAPSRLATRSQDGPPVAEPSLPLKCTPLLEPPPPAAAAHCLSDTQMCQMNHVPLEIRPCVRSESAPKQVPYILDRVLSLSFMTGNPTAWEGTACGKGRGAIAHNLQVA